MISFGETMKEVLKASKYNYLTGKYEAIGERIISIIKKAVEFILGIFNIDAIGFDSSLNSDILYGIFIIFAIIGLVSAGAFVFRLFLNRRRKIKAYSEIFDDYRSNKLSYDEIMSLVEENQNKANYREAVRLRYIGLIILFNARDIVRVTDSMTGGQFIREASANVPSFGKGVMNTVEIYYALFFGNKPVEPENYNNHVEVFNSVIREAGAYEK